MAIEVSGITSSVIGEIPQNNNGGKKEINGLESGQAAGYDKVSISEGASFIGNLKSAIDGAQSAPPSKINDIKQKIASGNYADVSKIAEGLINSLNITGE
jgi:anti-sigma28 factor (negative regulator of flagellin synthesis)